MEQRTPPGGSTRAAWIVAGGVVLAGLIVAGTLVATRSAAPQPPERRATPSVEESEPAPGITVTRSAPPALPSLSAIRVEDSGYSIVRQFGDTKASTGVVVRNDSEFIADNIAFDLRFFDEGGTSVASQEVYISYLLPGQRGAITDAVVIPNSARVTRMSVEVLAVLNWQDPPPVVGSFRVSDVQTKEVYGSPETTAKITSNFSEDVRDAHVVAVAYDSANRIIGGYFTFVNIPSQTTSVVRIQGLYQLPQLRKVRVFPMFSVLSAS